MGELSLEDGPGFPQGLLVGDLVQLALLGELLSKLEEIRLAAKENGRLGQGIRFHFQGFLPAAIFRPPTQVGLGFSGATCHTPDFAIDQAKSMPLEVDASLDCLQLLHNANHHLRGSMPVVAIIFFHEPPPVELNASNSHTDEKGLGRLLLSRLKDNL